LLLWNSSSSKLRTFVLGLLLACLASSRAHGDVGVVLNESLDTSIARITGSGHSAVYLSRVCPESPVKLRLCRADEPGSVISNYTTLGEDQPFEWNVVPLSMYVYGVEDPQYRPMVGSEKIKHVLEERYREKYLSAYCASATCRTGNKAEWRQMVGASLSRSIYMFVVETTVEQDLDLIAQFNSLPNQNHFNGVTRNCADFTRRVINAYFARATGPDYLNDFGITSPKAIARSFTRYALRHPEAHLRVVHYAQIPGTIKRSSECRAATEQLYRSKKLLVPMLLFANHVLPFVAASYVFTGRFNPQRELEKYPSVEAMEVEYQIDLANSGDNHARTEPLEFTQNQERAEVVGTSEEWKEYRSAFDSVVAAAVREEIIRDGRDLKSFFQQLDEAGTPVADRDGALWLEWSNREGSPRVGLSASNIFDPKSDSQLAYEVVLARTGRILNSPKHSRETMAEFKKDWDLLQHGDFYGASSVLRAAAPVPGVRGMSFTGK
jgi:hypothetical protein